MRLYGKNPVMERLKTNPKSIRKVYIQQGHPDIGYIRQKSKKWGFPIYIAPKTKIVKMARHANTQGLLIEIDDFAYRPYDELLEVSFEKKHTLLFLDGLNDPQNLGGIIRSAACLGRFSIILPTHHSAGITETVLRVACGGENFIPISRVPNLTRAIRLAKETGFSVAGTAVDKGEDIRCVRLPFPLGVVIGSEQKGIREVVEREVDLLLTLPMAHPRLSMNAAHAAALFCYEINRQKEIRQSGC